MGYRDDFYTKDNIIGYTGVLRSWPAPSIYFYDRALNQSGAITQHYDDPRNIGRRPVLAYDDYLIFNTKEGDPVLQSSRILGTHPIQITVEALNKIAQEIEFQEDINCMVEYMCDQIFHVSRSALISISRGDNKERDLLADMIKKTPILKKRYWGMNLVSPARIN